MHRLSAPHRGASYPSVTRRNRHTAAIIVVALALVCTTDAVSADPLGDFFKRVGRTLSKPYASPAPQTKRKTSKSRPGSKVSPTPAAPVAADSVASPIADTPAAPAAPPVPTPAPPMVRSASAAPQSSGSRDLPFGVPVANRPGFVTSPYAPGRGFVDVREFASGVEVKDPYTGKIFRTP
jgi:hypothetical protein